MSESAEMAGAQIIQRAMDCIDMAVESVGQPPYTDVERRAAEAGASMGMTVTIAWLQEHGFFADTP